MHLSFSFCITQMRTVLTLRAFLEGLNVFTVMVSAQWPWRVCCLFSHVQLLTSPWIVARQSPLSMGFSRQEYWSGLPFPSPGDLPYPGIKPAFLLSPALAGGFFTASTTWEANVVMIIVIWKILDRNIFQFLPLMTWVLQCPPCVLYFWFPASGFLVFFSHVTALSSYTPAPLCSSCVYPGTGTWRACLCMDVAHVPFPFPGQEVLFPFLPIPQSHQLEHSPQPQNSQLAQ